MLYYSLTRHGTAQKYLDTIIAISYCITKDWDFSITLKP